MADQPGEHRRFLVRLLVLMLLLALGVSLSMLLLGVNVLSTADIHTERVDVKVVDRHRAAFQITGFDIGLIGDPTKLTCVSGLFTPGLDATITYGRIGDGPMQITVTPPRGAQGPAAAGVLETASGQREFRTAVYMELSKPGEKDSSKCEREPAPRMPIWGSLTVGQEFHAAEGHVPEPAMILDGKFRVSAHTFLSDELYDVATVTVPAGGRIQATNPPHAPITRMWCWIKRQLSFASDHQEADHGSQCGQEENAVWWGAVYIDSQKTALVLAAATEASKISLYRPNRKNADVFGVSGFTQFTKDPTFLRLSIALFVLEMVGALATWFAEHFTGAWPDRSTRCVDRWLCKSMSCFRDTMYEMGYLRDKIYRLAMRIGRLFRGGRNG